MIRKLYRLITLVLIFVLSIEIINPIITKADVIGDSSSSWLVKNSDGQTILTITMEDGKITIDAQSHEATTNVRWETIGLTITRERVNDNGATARGKTGPAAVYTVYDNGHGELPLYDGDKDPSTDGTTHIEKTAGEVQEALSVNLNNIKANTQLYLHCIFRTYKIVNNVKIIRHDNIKNWEDIMTAENWGSATLNDFKKFYNMPIVFKPAKQPNDLYFVTKDGTKLKYLTNSEGNSTNKKALASALPGDQVSWTASKVPETIEYKGNTYDIYGYEIYRKMKPNDMIESGYLGEMDAEIQNIRNGTTDVWLGGMNINILYRERASTNLILNAVDENSPDHILKNLIPTHTISAGEKFIQPDSSMWPNIVMPDGNTYKRTAFYSYTYADVLGNIITKNGLMLSENTRLTFDIPIDIKSGGTITVSIYYRNNKPGIIPITISAFDKSTGKEIKSLGTDSVSGGERYNNSTAILDKITVLNDTYAFTGSWDWSYTSSSSSSVVKKTGSGSIISFTAPSAEKVKDRITIKIYYDKDPTPTGEVTLRVIMVGNSGKTIKELSKDLTTPGKAVSKTTSDERSVNGIVYKYLNKWDYDYSTSFGLSTKNGTGNTAAFTIPSNTKLGSTVTLRFYYDYNMPDVEVPVQQDPITKDLDTTSPYAVINGDKYGSSYFISEQGIPTTESQYVYVKTKDYLLGYKLTNKTGKITYYVPVTMHYTLKYYTATPAEYNNVKPITELVNDTQRIKVERAYSYWEITQLQYYNIDSAKIFNYSLPDGSVSLTSDNKYFNMPSISTMHSEDIKDHVIEPKQVKEGIEITAEPITSDNAVRPTVEYEDLTKYAVNQTDEAQVKNDYLMFNGSVIMNNEKNEKFAPMPDVSALQQCTTICEDKALYTDHKVIDAIKENGNYSSSGNLTYRMNPQSINAYDLTKQYNVAVNNVKVHTPVICDPLVTADNDKWTQLLDPVDGAIQMVLDPNTGLNDFDVKISNTLEHSNRLGYYTRDFSRSFIDPNNVSYIASKNGVLRNEMKLPFDVYYDILNDNNVVNDQFIPADTWIVLGRNKARLYVPLWVKEGTYAAQYRTIAVNGTDKLDITEETRNSSINNYVATSEQIFQISGRIYGLTIYDISDYPNWQDVFRKDNTMRIKSFDGALDGTKLTDFNKDYSYNYKVGTRNQYGNTTGRYSKYTFPLVNSSHPKYDNLGVLKTGYAVRFLLDTTGEMYSNGCHIKITPTFYYVDSHGKNRQQVDLYYKEEINNKVYDLVKVSSGIDLVNIQSGTTGNIYSRIPERELNQTAAVMNTSYSKMANQISTMYTYSKIKMLPAFRTFIGYDFSNVITGLSSYVDVRNATGETSVSLTKYMQRWYGTYKIPTNVHAVTTGYDVVGYLKKNGIDYSESFWLKKGYIIVNFDIITIDDKGQEHLSYINARNYLENGNCSMWVKEEAQVEKIDNKGIAFHFNAGDFLVYDIDKKSSDDYEGGLY